MGYDFHIVHTRKWIEASNAPITKADVDALIASDPELAWSTADYVDMSDETGAVTRYWMITWRNQPCFWWYRDQIQCTDPDNAQQLKLIQMAQALNAFAIGDDGEIYDGVSNPQHPPTVSFGKRVADWFAGLLPQRQPEFEHEPLPFRIGDRVCDPWGNEHTVVSMDPKAELGTGVIRTLRSDATEHTHSMIAHGLKPVAKC